MSQPIMLLLDVTLALVLGNFLMVLLISEILFMSLVLLFWAHDMIHVSCNII